MDWKSEVGRAMSAHFDARRSGDIETVISSYSDDWTDSKGFTKDSLRDGHLAFTIGATTENVQINLDEVRITHDGDFKNYSPVTIHTSKGTISYAYTLKKESDDVWRIIYTKTLNWEPFPMTKAMKARKDKIDATAMLVREHRETLLKDKFRPNYHFIVAEGYAAPFDPNGAIFWKGKYHLFYIFQDNRTGEKSDHWGHVSSIDLMHWRHHPTTLIEGMYSGNCFINENGTPTMCYHQVNSGNALAIALDDNLDEWEKLSTNPITPNTVEGDKHHNKYRSWDPFGWFDGEYYYSIFGGEHPAVAKSKNLEGPWEYTGDLFAHGLEGVSLNEDVSCAELFRLGNRDILLCISHRLGCRYYVGEWKDDQFYPEYHSKMSWIDNMFFAPESLTDSSNRRIMWAWILDYRDFSDRAKDQWSGTLSLPRVLTLNKTGSLDIDVAAEVEKLRYQPFSVPPFVVQADDEVRIDGTFGNSFELIIEFDGPDAEEFGVKVCVSENEVEQTIVSYDRNTALLKVNTTNSGPEKSPKAIESAPLSLSKREKLTLRVFVDKSVIEVFANSKQAISRRIFPDKADSTGVNVFAKGSDVKVTTFKSWQIAPSNPY